MENRLRRKIRVDFWRRKINKKIMTHRTLTVLPGGRTGAFPDGTLLIDALADLGAFPPTPCGGKGICGKCAVRVDMPAAEGPAGRSIETALACRTHLTRDLVVHVDRDPTARIRPPARLDPRARYGVAVDIGTTAIKIALADLDAERAVETDSFLNPQRRFGDDVIARITAAADESVRRRLAGLVRDAVATSVVRTLADAGIAPDAVRTIAFSGNTVMLYLLAGLPVETLGAYPYRTPWRDIPLPPEETPLIPAFAHATSFFFPIASAFLGGDLVGGLALTLADGIDRNAFFIDLGTNGEMFLIDANGAVTATSCAMGPALEGMNISCGMTADEGAVVHCEPRGDGFDLAVLGGGPARGISGTGLVDCAALLVRTGAITNAGRIDPEAPRTLPAGLRIEERDGMRRVRIAEGVAITQRDVRNLQLAKGASLAAARILLDETGTDPADITTVIVAGTLGTRVNMDAFRRLGFLPDYPVAAYRASGNTSLAAAARACRDAAFRDSLRAARDRIRVVELSDRPDFNDRFLASLNFA